jgi:arsenate reductase (thioredoxin)
MAKGFLEAFAGDKLTAVSTAVRSPDRNPLTVEVMKEVGIDISQQRAEDLAQSLKQHFAYVITVCDASRERFPVWPFTRNLFHWSLPDPTAVNGSAEELKTSFRRVRDEIRQKVREFTIQKVQGLQVRAAAAGMKS